MRLVPFGDDIAPHTTPAKVGGRWYYPLTRVTCMAISSEQATSGAYSGFMGKISSATAHHLFEIAALHPVVTEAPDNPRVACGRWLVAGLATQSGSGSVSAAVANAEISGRKNQLGAEARGLTASGATKLRTLSGKQLDPANIGEFGKAIEECVQWCVDHAATVDGSADPGSVFKLEPAQHGPLITATWALNSIAGGFSALEALDAPGADPKRARRPPIAVDALLAAALYHRLGIDPAKRPNATQQGRAKAVLAGSASLPAANSAVAGWVTETAPYLFEDRAVVALAPYVANRSRVACGGYPAAVAGPPVQRVASYEISAHAAIAAGAAGLVEAHTEADARYWRVGFDLEWSRAGEPGTVIINERYSAGYRAIVRFVTADANANASVIAAKTTLRAMATSLDVQLFGADIGEVGTVAALAPASINGFDVGMLQALGALQADFDAAVSDAATCFPVLTAVELNLGAGEFQDAVSAAGEHCAALQLAGDRVPRSVATKENGVDRPNFVFVYDRLGVTEKPTVNQGQEARRLLAIGT